MSNAFAIEQDGVYGLTVQAQRRALSGLTEPVVFDWLRQAGYIVFRNFRVTLKDFADLVARMSARVTLDPARTLESGVAQKVDAGLDAVGLHCENGNSPFRPDLCWFYCEVAPRVGSQTTVCDGYRAWDELSRDTQKAFLRQPIVYRRNVDAAKWKRFVFHSTGGRIALEKITISDLIELIDNPEQAQIRPNSDGSVEYVFRTDAVHQTLFDTRLAFANSILGPSYNYERPTISFADGCELSSALLQEIADATERVTENIDWQAGDVVLIDNTRVMHGRRRIEDPRRTIFNALSYIR